MEELWRINGEFMKYLTEDLWRIYDGYTMDLWRIYWDLWTVYGGFMVIFSWIYGNLMEDLWGSYGRCIEDLWMIYREFIEDLRWIYGGFLEVYGNLWRIFGWFMKELWGIYGCFVDKFSEFWCLNWECRQKQLKTRKKWIRKKHNTNTKENQWTKTMTSQEQHMKIIENEKNLWTHHGKTNYSGNQGQFCQHSKLRYFLAGTFGLCFFFRVFHIQRGKKQEILFKILLPSWFWHVLIWYFQGDAF